MTTHLLGRMMIALVISALSWVGMSMRTDAQQQRQQDQRPQQQQRLSQQQQKQLINQQQQRVAQYRQHLEQQESLAKQHAALLRQQKRMAQYRFQEQYLERLGQQQIRLRNERYDYHRDPYFYTAPIYRYNRGGRYYEEGFRAGKADRDDRWGSTTKTLMPIGTRTTAIVAITWRGTTTTATSARDFGAVMKMATTAAINMVTTLTATILC